MKNVLFEGVAAYADQFAIGHNGEPFYLSIYGNTQSVSSILAATVAGRPLQIQVSGEPFSKLQPINKLENTENYVLVQRPTHPSTHAHIKAAPVSWGRSHGIYYDHLSLLKQTKDDFVAIASTEEETRNRVFRTLDCRPLPLLQQWQDPLIEILEEEGHIRQLQSYGCYAYQVLYDEEAILKIIGKSIKQKALPLA